MYIRKYISVYKKIYRSIYENLFPHMRKFRHLLGAIKNADAELLGIGGEVFFEDTKALRIAEMF